jgi:hypothetical protein
MTPQMTPDRSWCLFAVSGLLLAAMTAGCSQSTSHGGNRVASTPTAQQQHAKATSVVEDTMRQSGVSWDTTPNDWAESCTLSDGSPGALFNVARTGAGVDDPQAVVREVGAAWKERGLSLTYGSDVMTSGTERYTVLGKGDGVTSILLGVAMSKSSLTGVSECGSGDADKL